MGILLDVNIAIEKSTPKMPNRSESRAFFVCPSCNRFLERHEQSHGNIDIPYCKWCGQKLDWGAFDNERKG